jgi:acetyl esterase/lipase
MISDDARKELDALFAKPKRTGLTLTQNRRQWEEECLTTHILPDEAKLTAVVAGGVPGEWMDMPQSDPGKVFLLLHGGGYNAGSPKTHRRMAANLAQATGMRVLVPDYRLAPEHPFPAGVKDALLAYGWLLSQGFSEADIVIGGDSAGGGLALSMLLALREAKAKMPLAAVLMAPWTDLTVSSPSYETLRAKDPIIDRDRLRQSGLWYAGNRDPADPMLSPLFADPTGLPPLLIHAGGDEVMVDDSVLFAEKAKAAGVETVLKVWPGLWHVFQTQSYIPEAAQAIREIGDFVHEQVKRSKP